MLALLRLPLEGPVGCQGASAAEAGLIMMMVAVMVMMIVMKVSTGPGSAGPVSEVPWDDTMVMMMMMSWR